MSSGIPRIYTSFAEFERDELRRLDSLHTSVDDLVEERFAEDLDFGGSDKPRISVTSLPLLLPISVYGGYFGAGAGTLLLGVLTIATEGDYRSANVAKKPSIFVKSPKVEAVNVFLELTAHVTLPA